MENKETKQEDPAVSCDAGSRESLSQTNELSTDASPPLSLILPPGRADRPTQPVSKETSAGVIR